MARKHHTPQEIASPLRQVEVLAGQGKPVTEAIRAIGVTEPTCCRWRSEYGGLKLDQVRRLKQLEQENGRLRRAVSELTLEKLILKEAASGSFQAPHVVALPWAMSRRCWVSQRLARIAAKAMSRKAPHRFVRPGSFGV